MSDLKDADIDFVKQTDAIQNRDETEKRTNVCINSLFLYTLLFNCGILLNSLFFLNNDVRIYPMIGSVILF